MINFKVNKHVPEGTTNHVAIDNPYFATVIGGFDMDPPAFFGGDGRTVAEAIGHCLIANREALGITFDLYEDGVLTGRSTYYNQPRSIETKEQDP